MPNLLPDWTLTLPWDLGDWNLRASGRLIWSIMLLIIGIAIVIALIKPPKLKRPFSTKVGVALFPVIIIGTLVLGDAHPVAAAHASSGSASSCSSRTSS